MALVKENRSVQFAIKALVDDKNDFASIEGEILGVVYGIPKFHYYLYGQRFIEECNHKPLSQISRKNLSLAPLLLVLRLRPGREMVLSDPFKRLCQLDKSRVNGTEIRIQNTEYSL